jgi:hypothetical protein
MKKRRSLADEFVDLGNDSESENNESFFEIEVCIRESYASLTIEKEEMTGTEKKRVVMKEPYRVISNKIQILDTPGIDDDRQKVAL